MTKAEILALPILELAMREVRFPDGTTVQAPVMPEAKARAFDLDEPVWVFDAEGRAWTRVDTAWGPRRQRFVLD